MNNPYVVLGVDPAATKDEIKEAYRKLAQKKHPDKVGPAGKEEFQIIVSAYDLLSNDEDRKRFDETGATSKPNDTSVTELTQLMAEVINKADDVAKVNVIELMRAKLKERIALCQSQKREVDGAIRKRLTAVKRLKVRAGTTNMLADFLNADVAEGRQLIVELDAKIAETWKLIDKVDHYSYEADPDAPTFVSYKPHLGNVFGRGF